MEKVDIKAGAESITIKGERSQAEIAANKGPSWEGCKSQGQEDNQT